MFSNYRNKIIHFTIFIVIKNMFNTPFGHLASVTGYSNLFHAMCITLKLLIVWLVRKKKITPTELKQRERPKQWCKETPWHDCKLFILGRWVEFWVEECLLLSSQVSKNNIFLNMVSFMPFILKIKILSDQSTLDIFCALLKVSTNAMFNLQIQW